VCCDVCAVCRYRETLFPGEMTFEKLILGPCRTTCALLITHVQSDKSAVLSFCHMWYHKMSGRRRVCCSVLQCVTVCCSVLQCVAVSQDEWSEARVLQCVAVCDSVLQCVAVCCSLTR